MQKDVAILLRIGGATGRNILAGILKRIKDRDNCTIRIASDADDFQRLASSAAALIAKSRYPLLRAISQCGFGSINHAKAVFKKRFGMTMREYRNGQTKP